MAPLPSPSPFSMRLLPALLLLALVPLAAAQPWERCDNRSGNYSAGSAYENNLLQLLLPDLRGSAYSSPSLFASSHSGSGAGTVVYGLMLCRGDISASDCYDCGTLAGQDVQRFCNRTRDVALCYNQCYVRVSDRDFLASVNNSGKVPLMSDANVSSGVDVVAYGRAVTVLLNATAGYAVETSSRRLFATGQLAGHDLSIPSMWSMAQCTPDMSPASCQRCLDELLGLWWQVFPVNVQGARIVGTRCNMRCETEKVFYNGDPMVKLQLKKGGVVVVWPAPAPAPSGVVVIPGTTQALGSPLLAARRLLEAITWRFITSTRRRIGRWCSGLTRCCFAALISQPEPTRWCRGE